MSFPLRHIAVGLIFTTVFGCLVQPGLAQGAEPDSTPEPSSQPANLVFTADKSALEIPFNSTEPARSTANLIAVVTDTNNQPIENASVAFASGNAWYPDIHGQVDDYEFQTTNADGVAFTTYAVNANVTEDWIDLHATVVIDSQAPIESRQFLHRRLQIVLNNPEDFTNRDIDAVAAGQEATQDTEASNEERLQAMAAEVQGKNTIKIEMDAALDPGDNLQSPPTTFSALNLRVRAVASRSLTAGGSTRPPNLGQTRLQFELKASDDHENAANLKHTQDDIFLNFQQTSLGGASEADSDSLTWAGDQAATNALYLNSRAWGQRELELTVRLLAIRPIDGDLLQTAGYSTRDDDSYLLAEETFTFNQSNPDRPEVKLELQSSSDELAPTTRSLTLTGRLSADGIGQWGEVQASVKSSDGIGEKIDQGTKLTSSDGEFSMSYSPVRDGQERELTITFTGYPVEGANRMRIEELGSAQTSIVVKQKPSITTKDDEIKTPDSLPNERILLGEEEIAPYTLRIYGNQARVTNSQFFEGFNLAVNNTIPRGTTINDLATIAGYRFGAQSFMKMTVEVTRDGEGSAVASDQLTGMVIGISGADSFRNLKSYLLAAEEAPTYYFERPNTSRGRISVNLDENGRAVFYFAPGDIRLESGQTKNVSLTFNYRTLFVRASIPVVRQSDLEDQPNGPQIQITPRILADVPTTERGEWPPAVKESLEQAEDASEFLSNTWEVVATVAPPEGKSLDSRELLLHSSPPVRYLAANGSPIFQTETDFVATLAGDNQATLYLQLTTDDPAEIVARHSLAGQLYEKTLRLSSGDTTPLPDGDDEGEGDVGDGDGQGDGDGGDGAGDEEDPQPPVERGPVEQKRTDSTLGVTMALNSDHSNIGANEKIQIPVTVDVPSDVTLPKSGLVLNGVAFELKPYYLKGRGQATFVSINQQTGQQRRYDLSLGSQNGRSIEYSVNPQARKFNLGYFELTKGDSAIDQLGVNLFYTFLRSAKSENFNEIKKEIRSRGEVFERGYIVWEKRIGIDMIIGIDTAAPPVQPSPTESADKLRGEPDESDYSFDFDPNKPLSAISINQAVDTAQAVFDASRGLNTRDKISARDSFDNLRPTQSLFNLRTFLPRLENVAEKAVGAGESTKLLLALANMTADISRILVRGNSDTFSGFEQRFIDQAVEEIKKGRFQAIDDIRLQASLREYGELIADQYETAGVYSKQPLSANPFGLGTSFAGSDTPDSNAVSIFDLLVIWFNSLFNRN